MLDQPQSIFDAGLEAHEANYVPLSPISFLRRAMRVFPHKIAVTHHDRTYTYEEFGLRVRKFATAIRAAGVKPGECVAVLSPNGPVPLEAHYAVPLAGAVLCMINTPLDAGAIGFILAHAEAKLFLVDREWAPKARAALMARQGVPTITQEDLSVLAPDGKPVPEDGVTLGEVPLAVITLKDGASVTEAELTAFCRLHLAGFKIPKKYRFAELPKTSTGKIQKHILRKEAG